MKSKSLLKILTVFITLSSLFFLGFNNTAISANHGVDNVGECADGEPENISLCIEHFEVDDAKEQCVNDYHTPDSIANCINNIEPASDGYGPNGYPAPDFGSGGTPGTNSCSDELDDGTCYGQDFEFFPDQNENPIYQRLNQIIAFLSVGVGVAVTISVIVASIQWSTSGGEPQKRAAAVKRLWNNGIALGVFVLGWLLLNWLIPGGPLN